ncbi:DEKNAAC103395 [Brettanomyces naardenensis]|uniref:DEKNAAC103395 n=1 Tax=Brettanomyces naardenensis TaxID=13370 RepID=A0A448YNZ7_BRENA|nr:DEKNAAC103395 [Brettanomyces naardenensis]
MANNHDKRPPKSSFDITSLPLNVLLQIFRNLATSDRLHFSLTCQLFFSSLIPRLYSVIIYVPLQPKQLSRKNYDNVLLKSDDYTLIYPTNAALFFHALNLKSVLGFKYSSLVQELRLTDLADPSIFDLIQWRDDKCPEFPKLRCFEFPEAVPIEPLTISEAPNLSCIYIDENFCKKVEKFHGSVDFIDLSHVREVYFKAKLGRNEDMLIFALLTKHPQMLRHLTGLHFTVDPARDSYDRVYRRVVGFFAILRRMGLVLHNVSSLSLPFTNHSTAVIVSLIGKHIYFENLTDLELYIEDDGGVLNLVESLQQLSSTIKQRGANINSLSVNYRLCKEDVQKNHLRSMMLLKLTEPFRNLEGLNISLQIEGLNLSNLLMILGTSLSNNTQTLKDIRIDIAHPSENLIGNMLPTLEDVDMLFPHLNYLNTCPCSMCKEAFESISGQETGGAASRLIKESIKVSSLMIIGHELDEFQRSSEEQPYCFFRNRYRRFIKTAGRNEKGYLFDHLVNKQLNESLRFLPKLKIFEICGMVYQQVGTNEFGLLFGHAFNGLEKEQVSDIVDMCRVLSGDYVGVGSEH